MYKELFYYQILNEYSHFYGDESFNKIESDIEKSDHSKKLIFFSLFNKLPPSGDEFVACIMSNIKYSFANGDALLVASLVLFKRWIIEYTSKMILPIPKDMIIEIEREILRSISQMNFDSSLPIMKEIKML